MDRHFYRAARAELATPSATQGASSRGAGARAAARASRRGPLSAEPDENDIIDLSRPGPSQAGRAGQAGDWPGPASQSAASATAARRNCLELCGWLEALRSAVSGEDSSSSGGRKRKRPGGDGGRQGPAQAKPKGGSRLVCRGLWGSLLRVALCLQPLVG